MKRMSHHDKLLPIEAKLASWHPLLRNIVIKAARSMIRISCSLQDKQKVLSKYDATLPNDDPFIPRSAAFKTTLSVKRDFCQDPEITALDLKIAASTKQPSVTVLGYICDSLKRVITLMTQEKVKQVVFHLVELTKHIINSVFENSLANLRWTKFSATCLPLYYILPFINDLTSNTPGFFRAYLSCCAFDFRIDVTKLFFFKECLNKTNESMDSAFASRKGQIHIKIVSAWLVKVFLPSSFELQNHHDTILRRKEADVCITAATRARHIMSASEATAEALALQAETRTSINTPFLLTPSPLPPPRHTHILHPPAPQTDKNEKITSDEKTQSTNASNSITTTNSHQASTVKKQRRQEPTATCLTKTLPALPSPSTYKSLQEPLPRPQVRLATPNQPSLPIHHPTGTPVPTPSRRNPFTNNNI
jgi:RNase P/RNase MRP subunit p29